MFVDIRKNHYLTVEEAFKDLKFQETQLNPYAPLCWFDTLCDIDYFYNRPPWQIVNRIPALNVLCRKAFLATVFKNVSPGYRHLFSFVPRTYILPREKDKFLQYFNEHPQTFILKPDNGSLGKGISFLHADETYEHKNQIIVAQTYIDPLLIDGYKFDLRIYVLLASITPLKLYVFHDGIVRVCSKKYTNKFTSYFPHLTNVTFNKKGRYKDISDISRLISEVYKEGNELNWDRIEEVILLSVLAALPTLAEAEEKLCSPKFIQRCFQILGFDILLDKEKDPHVLEVNYRPSLDFNRSCERRMKVEMIRDAINIACPSQIISDLVTHHHCCFTISQWLHHLETHPEILQYIEQKQLENVAKSRYHQIWPPEKDCYLDWTNVSSKSLLNLLKGRFHFHFPPSHAV